MKPNPLLIGVVDGLRHFGPQFTAIHPLLGFGVAQPCSHPHAEGIQQDSYGEQDQHGG